MARRASSGRCAASARACPAAGRTPRPAASAWRRSYSCVRAMRGGLAALSRAAVERGRFRRQPWVGWGGQRNQNLAILIEHADDLLESDFLGLFVSVLAQAVWNSNLRLDGDGELDEWRQRIAQHFVFLLDRTAPVVFTEKAARGTDVAVALSDGRLLATLTDVDWPGGDPASAPWTAGPLSFADEEILSGRNIEGIKMFRDHLGCSIHEALVL
ncbi:hypothetical protein [Streptomyces sp. ICC4]|nr:hypothetical protein [Streptomyces sp. ICC4]